MLYVLASLAYAAADPIRGVNLGGWLVMEPWITPKLFERANVGVTPNADDSMAIVDEWTWHDASKAGLHDRTVMIEDHWNTWVTQDHLTRLRAAGITHLRVPIGYWYFNTSKRETFASSVASYPVALQALKRMVNEWAAPLGFKVLLDMHTAPGSQNGFDNSGRRGDVNFLDCGVNSTIHPNDLHEDCPTPGKNFQRWADVITSVAEWMTSEFDPNTVWGLEVLNEPFGAWGVMADAINQRVDPEGYTRVRAVSKGLQVIFQTGFLAMDQQVVAPDYKDMV
jgi:glucan 1,3-beta-glucosidase